jgi:hypothetical protein
MANDALATYLNDHLAGSVVALELLEHLEAERPGSAGAPILATVRADIETDRDTLEQLMARLEIGVSRPRQATAWVTEKVGELKLRIDDPEQGALRRLEALETISLGIEGKRGLWEALRAASDGVPSLGELDYPGLIRRAADQRAVVERLRLQAATDALGD